MTNYNTKIDKKLFDNIVEDIQQFQNVFYGGNKVEDKYLSSGNEGLNDLLNGGYRKGELIEISGATDTGKTLLALKAIKEVQKEDKLAIYIDASAQLQDYYFTDNEIDKDGVIVIQHAFAEDIGIMLSEFMKENKEHIGLIIIDSLANLTTKKEYESKLSKNTDIHRSKVIKALLTRINNLVRNTEACAIILNQNRSEYDEDGSFTIVSSSERWVKMACNTRIRLSLDEEEDICVEVSFKNKLT